MKRRLISLNLAIIMILTLVPAFPEMVSAKDDTGYIEFYKNDGSPCTDITIKDYSSNANLCLYQYASPSTRTGYVATGYNTKADGSGTAYSFSDKIGQAVSQSSDSPTALYLQWTEAADNNILYVFNNKNSDGKDYYYQCGIDASVKLLGEEAFCTEDGRKVIGWGTGSLYYDDIYRVGGEIEPEQNVILYAVMGYNYITYHYKKYDKSTGENVDTEETKFYKNKWNTPGLDVESKSTLFWVGWNSMPDGTGEWYSGNDNLESVPHDLYAQYVPYPDGDYCTLVAEEGLLNGRVKDYAVIIDGKTILPSKLKGGSSIAYWMQSGGRKYYPCDEAVEVQRNTVLVPCEAYQNEQDGPTYYGILDGNGGITRDDSKYIGTKYMSASPSNLYFYQYLFTRDDAVQIGLIGGKTGNEYSLSDAIKEALIAESNENYIARFTAKYQAVNGQHVQYLGNGQTTVDGDDYYVQDNIVDGDVFAENEFSAPTGQHFLGWNTARDFYSGTWYSSGAEIPNGENLILYAQWGKNKVTYHFEDWEGRPVQETSTALSIVSENSQRHMLGDGKDGYVFCGWNTSPSGDGEWYHNDQSIEEGTVLDLYAQWAEIPEFGYYYILSANPLPSGETSKVFVMETEQEEISLPSGNMLGWYNDNDKQLLQKIGFLDEESRILECGSKTTVDSGTRLNGFYPHTTITYHENEEGYDETRICYDINTSCSYLQLYSPEEVFEQVPEETFAGWNTSPDASGKSYSVGQVIGSQEKPKGYDLYAIWGQNPYEHYIIVDGKYYDATENHAGAGWDYYYHGENSYQQLSLNNYKGGQISSDLSLSVGFLGNNVIEAEKEYGIFSEQNLSLSAAENYNGAGHLTVIGADGYEAIKAEGSLFCSDITAKGGGKPALSAKKINLMQQWPSQILVGENDTNATEGDYDGQHYVEFSRRPYSMTFWGNGGLTAQQEESKNIVFTTGSPGWLFLYPHKDLFTNGDKRLLGWSENENATYAVHATNEEYQFAENTYSADLYAVWEDEISKGVILKNFYGRYGSTGWHNGDEVVSYVEVGNKFTLPEPHRNGCTFDGWIAEDNTTIYNAGEEIIVSKTTCFTAKYSPLSMTIDGKTFNASKDCGSNSIGWKYYAGEERAQLNIYENYSGKPISIPTDAFIILEGDVYGEDNSPAIFVDGDLLLSYSSFSSSSKASILAGDSAPAISVAGTVDIVNTYQNNDLIICGGEQFPAIVGESIRLNPSIFFAGTSSNNEKLVTSYSGERYVRLCCEENRKISLQSGEVVPSIDNSELLGFIGYTKKSCIEYPDALNTVWYLPGDIISEPSGIELFPQFLKEQQSSYTYARIVSIDGNGGTTSTGSKHSIEYVWLQATPTTLQQYRLPSGDRFSREGYSLSDYNTAVDGTGTSYSIGQGISQDESILVHKFYAQWRYIGGSSSNSGSSSTASTTEEPIKINGGAAEYTKADAGVKVSVADASKLISKSSGKELAVLDLSKAGESVKQVSIPTDAINDVAEAGADSLEIKMPNATVSFDAKTLEAIISQTAGTDINLTVSVGSDAESNLNSTQKAAFKDAKEYSVIDISLTSNGEKISDFDGGCVTIDIPFKWSRNGFLRAYFVDESGQKTPVDITYANGMASLTLTHFSTYVIEVSEQIPFTDVPQGEYYYDAVTWALKNNITRGTTTTTFAPDAITTRGQMVTLLWRAAGSPEPTSTSVPFTDIAPTAFYYKAALWAAENDIVKGVSSTAFSPNTAITRGQCVTFLARYEGVHDNAIAYKHSFNDVTSTDYFNSAVAWAETNGITTGTTKTTFAPNDTCTRGQIVTFLYRAFAK